MLKVGLTGGLGSGKSTVARIFAQYGVRIVDADVLAHDLTQPDTPHYKKIVDFFGHQVLLPPPAVGLDRVKLRAIIFQDTAARIWLENLLHPDIIDHLVRAMQKEKEEQEKKAPSYVIAVVPLLIETQLQALFDRIVVVDTTRDLQYARSQARDPRLDLHTIEAILLSQCTREERLRYADEVLVNNTSLSVLQQQVEQLHKRLNLFSRYTS